MPIGRAALGAVARRPDLWVTAARVGWRLAPRGWWRRRPLRPWPDARYLRFRLETMYGERPSPDGMADGTAGGGPAVEGTAGDDVVRYLEWCRRLPGGSR